MKKGIIAFVLMTLALPAMSQEKATTETDMSKADSFMENGPGRKVPAAGKPASEKKNGGRLTRLARVTVDPMYLEQYHLLLKEPIETALRLEPGVLALYALANKDRPEKIVIPEIHADEAAYRSHPETYHFRQYKQGTIHMVKSPERIDSTPLLPRLDIRQERDR